MVIDIKMKLECKDNYLSYLKDRFSTAKPFSDNFDDCFTWFCLAIQDIREDIEIKKMLKDGFSMIINGNKDIAKIHQWNKEILENYE